MYFLITSRNKQSQQPLDIQKLLKQQLIHLEWIWNYGIFWILCPQEYYMVWCKERRWSTIWEFEIETNGNSIKVNPFVCARQILWCHENSCERFLNIYISTLRNRKAGSLELFLLLISAITNTVSRPGNPIDTKV